MKKILLFMLGLVVLHNTSAQTGSLIGKIGDSEGKPLENVNILVQGTENGTTTDARGDFELKALPDNFTLEISYLGFETQEVEIDFSQGVKNIFISLDARTYTLQ